MRVFWTKNFAKSSVSREDCATAEEKRANVDIWTSNIPSMTGLNLLINAADKRKTIGHWESDTVRGSKWTGCIATHVERKSRYAVLCKIPNRTAEVFTQATIQAFQNIPKGKCKSFCADHGKEFSDYRIIQTELNCKVYFADPHAPWQRGTNENFNGLLRQFFPNVSFSLSELLLLRLHRKT